LTGGPGFSLMYLSSPDVFDVRITNLYQISLLSCKLLIQMNVVFQLLQAKQAAADKREQQGKVKFEYDSDEDTEGGTWEHKRY
jgi:splicing factor 4